MAYNDFGNVTSTTIVWSDGTTDKTLTQESTFNEAGSLVKSKDLAGNIIENQYNVADILVASIDKFGQKTEYTYDVNNRQIKVVNSDGSTTYTVYDAEGRVLVEQESVIGSNETTGTRYVYDSIGRTIRVEKLVGLDIQIQNGVSKLFSSGNVVASSSVAYDAIGQKLQETDSKGNTTKYEYNAAGYNTAIVDALGGRTEFTYDANGRRTAVKDALGYVVTYEYDANGQKIKTIYPDGSSSTSVYNKAGYEVEFIDAAGITSKKIYDDFNRLIQVVKQGREGQGDVIKWEYAYNEYNRLLSVKDPRGNATLFTYDHLNRPVSRTLPMGQQESTEYNTLGQIVKQIDFKGNVTAYSYDDHGRLYKKSYFSPNATTSSDEETFVYDSNNRITQVIATQKALSAENDKKKIYEFRYDLNGQITQKTTL